MNAQDRPASLEPDPSAGLESEIRPLQKAGHDLLALATGQRRPARQGEGAGGFLDRLPQEGQVAIFQGGGVGEDRSGPAKDAGLDLPREPPLHRVSFARQALDFSRHFGERFFSALGEEPGEVAPDAVSRETQVPVGGVAAMADTPLSQEVEDLPTGHVQHRSDDAVRSLTFDAGEARETCPPLARQEICLQPVLPLVRGHDPLRTGLSGHLSERGVTRVPGAGFRGKPESPGLCPGVAPPEEAGEPEPPRVLPHEREVPVRLPPPPAVVDVGDGERPAGCANAFRRAMKKRHGVGAPRNGQQMRGPRRHQPAFGGFPQSVEDGVHQLMVRRSSPVIPLLFPCTPQPFPPVIPLQSPLSS